MDDTEEIDLQRYLQVLLRYWWLVLLGPLLAGLAAFAFTWTQAPHYQAATRILVQSGGGTQDLGLSSALARSYTELVRTTPVLDGALDELGLELSPAELRPLITAGMVRDTQILEVQARYTDPQAASDIANTVSEVFIDFILMQRLEEIARLQASAQAQGVMDISSLIDAQLRVVNSLTIIEPAIPPTTPVRSRESMIVLVSVVMGLLAAVLAAFVVHHLRDRVESPEILEKRFGLVPLGSVSQWTPKDIAGGSPVMMAEPGSRFAEEFRHVRASLQFTAGPAEAKSVVVTSAGPAEGKSTIASNLAIALAQDGKRVALVDADQRRPSQHHVFDLPNTKGLSNYLALNETTLDDVLQATDVPNLAVVTSGPHPPNPAELLGSQRMRRLLEELSGRADFVLLDSPPVLAVADASLLAAQSDGVVLIADTQQTKSGAFAAMLRHLERTNARILGVVLDKLRPSRFSYGYSHYYHYYGSEGSRNGHGDGHGQRRWAEAPREWLRQSVSKLRGVRPAAK